MAAELLMLTVKSITVITVFLLSHLVMSDLFETFMSVLVVRCFLFGHLCCLPLGVDHFLC